MLISIRWHLLAANMREEQSAPLANLSAVNYGNLPSCLSAFAAGLPFVSKSKAGICNIGTLPFLQGHVLHKRLMMGDIYSRRGLRVPLQKTKRTNAHTDTQIHTGTHNISWEKAPVVLISTSKITSHACRLFMYTSKSVSEPTEH